MITYRHRHTAITSRTEQKVPGLGWAVVGRTEHGGFAVLALEAHGTGFKTRGDARAAKAKLKGELGA